MHPDLRELLRIRRESGAGGFVTTEKDAVNLGGFLAALEPPDVSAMQRYLHRRRALLRRRIDGQPPVLHHLFGRVLEPAQRFTLCVAVELGRAVGQIVRRAANRFVLLLVDGQLARHVALPDSVCVAALKEVLRDQLGQRNALIRIRAAASLAEAASAIGGVLDAAFVQVAGAVQDTSSGSGGDFRVIVDDGSGGVTVVLDGDIGGWPARSQWVPGVTATNLRGLLVPESGVWVVRPRAPGDVSQP